MGALIGVLLSAWLAVGPPDAPPPQVTTAAAEPIPPPSGDPTPIQDNSFLIEEAYNQEAGVVQHIATFQRDLHGSGWTLSFTDEWPAAGQRHQLSVTLAGLDSGGNSPSRAGLGDTALNYRYQILSGGRTAVAPRFSVVLPTGDYRVGRGMGAVGYQVNVPTSVQVGPRAVTHVNAGFTVIPGARNERGESATAWNLNVGQSIVWLAKPLFNPLLEVVYSYAAAVTGPGSTTAARGLWINPGVRGAFNFRSGLQIVPGLSMPIGLGPSAGERAVFFYLSFEHPLFRR